MSSPEQVIRAALDAADGTPSDHPDPATYLNSLGIRLGNIYSRTGALDDLEGAIHAVRKAADATPPNHPDLPGRLNNLGLLLVDRYLRTGAMADLEEAIQVTRIALNKAPSNHRNRAAVLNSLGLSLAQRYRATGVMVDLEEAIRVTQEAVDETPSNHPSRAKRLSNLGVGLGDRYKAIGLMTDLDDAIQFIREAVQATPSNHPNRPNILGNLGVRLRERYSTTGEVINLEEAIQMAQEAIDATPINHPDRVKHLGNLGLSLEERYLRTGAMVDLEEALRVTREAFDKTPSNHIRLAGTLNNLGILLGQKYKRTGAIANLDDAIRDAREALKAIPLNHPNRTNILNSLGVRLGDRYTRTGAMTDLEEAIQTIRAAVVAISPSHPTRFRILNNLGILLGDKYSRTGVIDDLEEAIGVGREAIDATPIDHPGRAILLSNLGLLLGERYTNTGARVNLEEAIRVGREAIDATPIDYPDRAKLLSNLGLSLGEQYTRMGAMIDLEETIRVVQEAVNATPPHHPDAAKRLNHLGVRLSERYNRAEADSDLNAAVSHHQAALQQSNAPSIARILAGSELVRCYAITSGWQQAYEASDIAIRLIPKLTARSLENPDRQYILSQVVGLASDAAAAALHAEKGPFVALDFLELGRGVLAASLEELRTDILDLRIRYPKLAERFVRFRDELDIPVTRNYSLVDENVKSSWQAQATRRYEASQELDNLIIEIRKRPGFEDFLLAPSEGEMQAAARCGPIVVINVSEYRCDAIFIEQHQIRSLALPYLNSKEIKERAQGGDLGSPKVLEWLWDVVANPILDALGFTQPPSDDNWPHVWWIPTGPLSKFPLHAAGRHGKDSSETVLDRVISSYSSSIKAIIHGRRRRVLEATSTIDQALLVSMRHTPGQRELRFAVDEVAMLYRLCKSMTINPIEPGRHKQDIISHLPNCKIFHFAGHGHTDNVDPSQSSLLLEDWQNDRLTVATLLEINLRERPPFLAYLSACGTGRIKDERFIDESIHLISGCQLAGFRHVIGTLWEVNDELCVDTARITYEWMRDGGMTDESICRGLHKATRELRDRWLNVPAKARQRRRSVRKGDVILAETETGARNTSDGDHRDDRLPRDVVLCDDDDDEWRGPLYWVPYVHFGV